VSAIKYQLLELLPSLVSQAQGNSDPEIKTRFKFLKRVAESKQSIERVCEERGRSTQYFYKWAEALLKSKNLFALKSRSRRPKRSPGKTRPRVEKRIRKLRELQPFQGGDRISQDLKDMYNITCPPRTVNAVLKRQGFTGKTNAKRLTKRHLKRYRRPFPGYLQMDFKYVPYLIEGQQFYQLSCVDHHSSWRLIRNYRNKDEAAVAEFLRVLIEECPFPIFQIQTDNDASFTDKFTSGRNEPTGKHLLDQWCRKKGIEHRLIPIGQKELNGKVENTHKFDDREYFSQIHSMNFSSLEHQTRLYNNRWNDVRKTKTLGWKTPFEVIIESHVRALAYVNYMHECFAPRSSACNQANETFRATKPAPRAETKKPKRLSIIDRYLQYVDWDDKQRLKILLPLLAMSLPHSMFMYALCMLYE
jgi:transposase InsO family protein